MSGPLWQPSRERIERANLTAFMRWLEARRGVATADYPALYRWSIEHPDAFWSAVWDFCEVIGDGPGPALAAGSGRMPGTVWFPEARLNFAENLLRRRDATPAVVFRCEDRMRRVLTWSDLRERVARLAAALRGWGVQSGDRVAGFLPNLPETLIAMLASASIGAIWSSSSPDFGARGILDRFGQIAPRVLFAADGYWYNGNHYDCLARVEEICSQLPSVERVVLVPYTQPSPPRVAGALLFDEALDLAPDAELVFERLPFAHPLYILYSSGTTGPPKCIVHGAGGTLLQHLKEHRLHTDLRVDDHFFYFTTCGWMMWNWLVSGLASQATLLLYEGSPAHPDMSALFRFADTERVSVFGTSAKFIDGVAKSGVRPRRSCDLSSLRALLSTGSPLAPESFDFVYREIHPDICLSSISGGTDIVSCFALGNPIGPVWRGEIQARGLGMKVEVYDASGQPVREQKGELVCTAPFPSMPVGFWDDPDGARFRAAYFEKHPGVWSHGDFAEITEHDGVVIYGRSDAVLNPGGVRIGTAEIYRQVEQIDEVLESLVIGQEWGGDVRVVLFVRLRDDIELTDPLRARIAQRIRENASPRHVPDRILQVPDIPHTRSGKIVELAVRDVVHGRPVANRDALANPEALAFFAGRAELDS
ncbi:MAG: acetoacetate--CoA ligase [Myxococcales bacterium]|nr:acetoacetate--CoA ligase [Myxococcales bacterium]MDH5567078.1 acetoacetate--CoA ligase [Myxococcales bacterium]